MQRAQALLEAFAKTYEEKRSDHAPVIFNVKLRDEGAILTVDLTEPGTPRIVEGAHPEAFHTFVTDVDTLEKMHSGELGPGTASGKEHVGQPSPLDSELPEGESWTMERIYRAIEVAHPFFNPFNPEKIRFGEEHARFVHGGHAVVFFYARGFRSAWYSIHQGERVNSEEHANPFPSGIIVLSGRASGRIGGKEIELQAHEAYLIPAGATHTFWNEHEEPLTAIYLAWGEGA